MALNPMELLGLTPPIRIKGEGVKVIEGEVKKRRPRRTKQVIDPAKKREYNRRWQEKDPEHARLVRLAGAKRYYWKDVEKSRAYHRKRQAGKQLKANYTPEEWRRRLDMSLAARRRREERNPAAREERLSRGRAYWAKKQAEAKANG